jgi:hypothetical protein
VFKAIEIIVLVFLSIAVLNALISVHSGATERAFHDPGQQMNPLIFAAVYCSYFFAWASAFT